MTPFSVSGLETIINQLLPEPHAALLAGLLFGTKSSLSPDFYTALSSSGTLHIIALSGQNISIMESLIGTMLRPLVGKRLASGITIGIIIWFVWFVGPSPSIIRAAVMGSIGLLAILFGRQYWAILSWILTCGVMLLIHGAWLFDISFQLSALATLGIILFGKQKTVSNQWWVWRIIKDDLRLTLSAQVFTIPLSVVVFRQLSLVSPLANLAIGWVIAPVTLLGWMTVLAGYMLLYAGQILAWVDWILLEYVIRTVYIVGGLPFATIRW